MLLYIKVLNTPGAPYVCEGEIREACFGVKGLELEVDDLVIKGSRNSVQTWGSTAVIAMADLCSEKTISVKTRGALSRAISAAIKRAHGARHHSGKVVIRYFEPTQVTIHERG